MKTKELLMRSVLGGILLTLIFAVANILLDQTQDMSSLLWGLIANFLIALLLGYYIVYSHYAGIRLTLAVFLIYFLIGHFNILIEAYIFNITDREQTLFELLRGLEVSLVFCPIYVYLIGHNKPMSIQKFAPLSILGWTWRILAANFLYLVFYITAGLILSIVYPALMTFYEGKIPPIDLMIKTQLFLRGFIFIAVALLILRSLALPRLKKAVLVGVVFAILGGIAPLIQPNELMPTYVRLGHGFEVGISNFLFGFTISYLLKQKTKYP